MLGVIAGDSLVVRATTWLGQEVETTVRLLGVDTLELRAACGEEWNLATRSRAFTAWLVETGAEITLSDIQLGKFAGRVLAHVVTAGGVDIGQALIDAGLARPYRVGRRGTWCVNFSRASASESRHSPTALFEHSVAVDRSLHLQVWPIHKRSRPSNSNWYIGGIIIRDSRFQSLFQLPSKSEQ